MNRILPNLAFSVLKQAKSDYENAGSFTNKMLEDLHFLFGESFALATELLEKSKVIEYTTGKRRVFQIENSKEQFTVYEDINFCTCDFFKIQVLESQNYLTCRHVLAVNLAKITNQIAVETIKDRQLLQFLNNQILDLDES